MAKFAFAAQLSLQREKSLYSTLPPDNQANKNTTTSLGHSDRRADPTSQTPDNKASLGELSSPDTTGVILWDLESDEEPGSATPCTAAPQARSPGGGVRNPRLRDESVEYTLWHFLVIVLNNLGTRR